MELEQVYDKIDTYVSLIEFSVNNETVQYATNFVMEYYITQIQRREKYKVINLSAFIYDVDRFQHVLSERQSKSQIFGFKNKVYESISVQQCLSLFQYNNVLNQLANDEKRRDELDLIVLEDLDEAFTIATFENYITAVKLITNIVRIVRKLSQLYNITCIILQRKCKSNFHVRHIGRFVRSMMDNQVMLDGCDMSVSCVYD